MNDDPLSAAFTQHMLDALSASLDAGPNDPKANSFESMQQLVRGALAKTFDECYASDQQQEKIFKHLADCETRAQQRMLDRASAEAPQPPAEQNRKNFI